MENYADHLMDLADATLVSFASRKAEQGRGELGGLFLCGWPKVYVYRNSSMHASSASLLGRTADSGNVASGWSVTFSMSMKLGALALM